MGSDPDLNLGGEIEMYLIQKMKEKTNIPGRGNIIWVWTLFGKLMCMLSDWQEDWICNCSNLLDHVIIYRYRYGFRYRYSIATYRLYRVYTMVHMYINPNYYLFVIVSNFSGIFFQVFKIIIYSIKKIGSRKEEICWESCS